MIEEFETIARAHCTSACRDWTIIVKLPQASQFLVYYANKDAGHVFPHGEVISCCALL